MTDTPVRYSRAERDLIDAAFPDRTAGRWCVHCQQHGSHHSEQHDDFAAEARRAASLPLLPPHVAVRVFEATDPFETNVVAFRADPGMAMPAVEVPAGFVRMGFDKPEPEAPATPADLDRAAWDRLHREADRLRPKAGPRSDGLPPLALDADDTPSDADDFLISAGTMQDVEVMCLRKGCTWRIDVERETGHAFPLLSGVLARVERHRRDDHGTGR